MDNLLVMKVVDCHYQLYCVEDDGLFRKLFLRFQNFVQLATLYEWHDKIESHLILKQEVHLDEERMVALEQDVLFPQSVLNLIVFYQYVFTY